MNRTIAYQSTDAYSRSAVPAQHDVHFRPGRRDRFFESVSALVERRRVGGFDAARTSYCQTMVDTDVSFVASEEAFVVLEVAGAVRMRQGRTERSVEIGNVVLIDSDQSYHLTSTGKVVQLILRIPADIMDERVPGWRDRVACPLPRNVATMIAALVRSGFEQVFEPTAAQSRAAGEALIGLIASAIEEDSQDVACLPLSHVVRRVQDALLARLGDERFDPATIARANGVSERQLQRLFHEAGTSLCRWIKQARLDHCAADLANPDLRERSITEIAFGWGFNDAAHFSRTFRAEFGMTPRDYRSTALAAQGGATGSRAR